jgi:UDP-N-acetylmuramoyl-L-alanyl-D-glutamate--2,6-diaminopimelate ligase
MGGVAARLADRVYVTDDNPRSEDAAAIRAVVLMGAPGAVEIGDRGEAIGAASGAMGPGDLLLVAGKGHETGQIVGDRTYPFDDVEQASVAVAALDGRVA